MNPYTLPRHIEQLKSMHDLMLLANDEEIYATWIVTGIPDEPTEEDFSSIAEDEQSYNEVFDLFVRLIALKGNR